MTDQVTVSYDPRKTDPRRLQAAIQGAGFNSELVTRSKPTSPGTSATPVRVDVPNDAPEFFRTAIAEARRKGIPVVIDFHASWCLPCRRLDTETLHDKRVARALEGVQFVKVDLDLNPSRAKLSGVVSVPHVVFIGRGGLILDRLTNFEAPAPFRKRLRRLLQADDDRQALATGG